MDYLALSCFGKVPCDREYLDYRRVNGPSSSAFVVWMREGFKAARVDRSGEPTGFEEGPGKRVMFARGDADWLAGVVGPSQDLEGRKNVFAAFVTVPRKPFAKASHLLPLALAPVWSALEDAWSHLVDAPTLEAFEEVLDTTQIPSTAGPLEVKADFEARTREAIAPVFERTDGALLAAVLHDLPNVVREVKSVDGKSGVAVEVPVSRDPNVAAFDVSFWIDLVGRQFFWKRPQPSVFMDRRRGERDRSAILVYGVTDEDFYAPIMAIDSAASAPESRYLRPAFAVGSAAVDQGATYADVLKRKLG